MIRELSATGVVIDHVRRTDRSGFKAGACAHGLSITDEPFIAMLDADFRPPANWLKRTVPLFLTDPRAGFVQSRCEFANYETNWLTRAQGLIQDGHYMVEQRSRALAGWLFQFNGTGGIWRRAAVEEAGGWSHDTLSEDLDLVMRTALHGWHGVFLMEPHVVGELPARLEDFGAQQSRWSKGFVQVARKLILPIWKSGWSDEAKFTTTVALGQQLIFPVLVVGVVALVLSMLGHGHLPGLFRPTRVDGDRRSGIHQAHHDGAHRTAILAVTKDGQTWNPVFVEPQLSYAQFQTTTLDDAIARGVLLVERWL